MATKFPYTLYPAFPKLTSDKTIVQVIKARKNIDITLLINLQISFTVFQVFH